MMRSAVHAPTRLLMLLVTALYLLLPGALQAKGLPYQLEYRLEFLPQSGQALVTITLDKGELLRSIRFDNLPERYEDITASGKLMVSASPQTREKTFGLGTLMV